MAVPTTRLTPDIHVFHLVDCLYAVCWVSTAVLKEVTLPWCFNGEREVQARGHEPCGKARRPIWRINGACPQPSHPVPWLMIDDRSILHIKRGSMSMDRHGLTLQGVSIPSCFTRYYLLTSLFCANVPRASTLPPASLSVDHKFLEWEKFNFTEGCWSVVLLWFLRVSHHHANFTWEPLSGNGIKLPSSLRISTLFHGKSVYQMIFLRLGFKSTSLSYVCTTCWPCCLIFFLCTLFLSALFEEHVLWANEIEGIHISPSQAWASSTLSHLF